MDLPPSYGAASADQYNIYSIKSYPNYTSVDFAPILIRQEGSEIHSGNYEPFSELIIRANKWLRTNHNYSIEGCETVGVPQCFFRKEEPFDTQDMSYFLGFCSFHITIFQFLRLYVRLKKCDESPEPQEIGHFNILPRFVNSNTNFSHRIFGTFDETLKEFNKRLDRNPIPGKILNIETVTICLDQRTGTFPTDSYGYLQEVKDFSLLSTMLRLFYIRGPPLYEKIGSTDFKPALLKRGGFFTCYKFETLFDVMPRMHSWLSSQRQLRVTNIQTLKIDCKNALEPNVSNRIDYILAKHTIKEYFNMFRIFFVTGPNVHIEKPINLSYRVFESNKISKEGFVFEKFDEFFSRKVLPFITFNSQAKVINFEVDAVNSKLKKGRMSNSGHHKDGNDLLVCIKVYFNGIIEEPPVGVIHEEKDSCTVL